MDGFRNFLTAFGAADRLLARAHANGSLIEGTVLFVSMIDGLLRIALVLDAQLAGQNVDLAGYTEQVEGGRKLTERQIFTEAHSRGLLDDALQAEIAELYEHRNAVIHRFFLTHIKYGDLPPPLDRYARIYERCYAIVDGLETRQVLQGTGMTMSAPRSSDAERDLHLRVLKKLGLNRSTEDNSR